jgi:3-polyprenyl-4-hydroxybenzoate decarboxylase
MKKRLIVGITGATGAVYGVEILKVLKSVSDGKATSSCPTRARSTSGTSSA